MPKIEDLEKLGSIAFLIGNKALPKEISQEDYNNFKSVFTDEHMANSLPAEDDDLPSIDNLDSLDLDDADIDDLELPEGLDDDKVSADIDDLGLPEDLDDDKVSADIDDLGLPEDLDDDKVSADIDDLGLPEDLDDDKVSADIDDLDLPEDKELEDKIAMDIKDNEKHNDIHSEKLPALDDLPLPDSLPAADENTADLSNTDVENIDNETNTDDLDIEGISDNLDDILEDEDSSLDNLENILNDDDDILENNQTEEEVKDEKEEEKAQEEEKTEEDKVQVENEEQEKNNEDDLDSLSLDDITEEEEVKNEKEEEKTQEDEKTEEDKVQVENEEQEENNEDDLDNLSLDDITEEEEVKNEKEEEKTEEDKVQEENEEQVENEEQEKNNDDLDNLSLDDITEEEEVKYEKEEEKTQEENNEDDLDLDNIDLDDTEEYSSTPSNNIVAGSTTLPAPETANSLPDSKYEDVDNDIDHDKVINSIKYLPPITKYHVLDAILNEKLDRSSMETLLNALERGESSENITELLNKELGLSLKEEGRKNVLELIPIPNSLKDYAKIIRVAAIFLILFIAIVLFSFQFIYKPVMANKYYSEGLLSISRGAYHEGERYFAEGERYKPKQIKWYNKYARAYIARETFNEAYNKIQGALNIKPRDFETRITFGFYYRKKGEKELSLEDYILGEELYNDMIVYTDKKKEKETIYDERGLLMISRARNMREPEYYDTAYNNYRDMVNFFGDGVIPRKRAMLIKIYQDNYNQVKALQNHINLLKSGYIDDEVYPKLAKYLLDKDDFYGSRVLFENLLTAYPNNLESIVGYADYETRLKHYERAMEILNTAALPLYEANPFYRGKEYVYNMLGQIYYNLGEYGNAVKNFNEALAIDETYPDANYNLGNVYFYKEEDYPKAKEHYQKAYNNLAPNFRSDKLLYNLSWLYYLDSEYDRAFEGFNALFQKNPSNSVVSYALGNSLLHLDKANLANGFYRNALSQILAKKEKLGRLEMRTESDFILLSYLASLYNNIGVAYAYNSAVTNTIINEQEAFKHFVLASEYFDQIRTSNIDLERIEKRTILLDNQNVGAGAYNIMSMQGRRDLKQSTIIDDYIPKDMNYLK